MDRLPSPIPQSSCHIIFPPRFFITIATISRARSRIQRHDLPIRSQRTALRVQQQPIRAHVQDITIPSPSSEPRRHGSHQTRRLRAARDRRDMPGRRDAHQRVRHVLSHPNRAVGSDGEVVCRGGAVGDNGRLGRDGAGGQVDGHLGNEAVVRVGEEKFRANDFDAVDAERRVRGRDRLEERMVERDGVFLGVHVQRPHQAGLGVGNQNKTSMFVERPQPVRHIHLGHREPLCHRGIAGAGVCAHVYLPHCGGV